MVNFTATPNISTGSPNYQFLLNGSEVQASSPTTTYASNSLAHGDQLTVVITAPAGGCFTTTTSQDILPPVLFHHLRIN